MATKSLRSLSSRSTEVWPRRCGRTPVIALRSADHSSSLSGSRAPASTWGHQLQVSVGGSGQQWRSVWRAEVALQSNRSSLPLGNGRLLQPRSSLLKGSQLAQHRWLQQRAQELGCKHKRQVTVPTLSCTPFTRGRHVSSAGVQRPRTCAWQRSSAVLRARVTCSMTACAGAQAALPLHGTSCPCSAVTRSQISAAGGQQLPRTALQKRSDGGDGQIQP